MIVALSLLVGTVRLVDFSARQNPQFGMMIALFSYSLSVLLLLVVLAVVSPAVVHRGGAAAGLVAATLLWTGQIVRRSLIGTGRDHSPASPGDRAC